ncbi:MAG TPA: redox-sensing transcriptional repressor Rex [Clostridia bacterium]|nr:redox-sensing transcriptional repressor Rex [Clostridia bacterium]
MQPISIPLMTLKRLPLYVKYLKSLPQGGALNISATAIAEALDLNSVQVRKDLALVSSGGRPRIGYITEDLILDIEQFLGYGDTRSAVLVGAGNLGKALLSYKGFSQYGLDIVAAFDTDPSVTGTILHGTKVLQSEKLFDLCKRMNIRIGIITVPESGAQSVCDTLVQSGVLAIWNFAPVKLRVPENVLVLNENMASSLAVLSKHLNEQLYDAK